VPKFELYKHNDELFNIYYGIYYELWTFAYLKFLFLVMVAILDTGRRWRTQFWKGTTQGSFQQSLVEIGSVVSEEKIFFLFHPPFFLICILYKHNDEFFNIYYGIFYELWTFAYFDRLCKLEKRGDEIKKKSSPLKLLSQTQPNFAEMILGWSPFKIIYVSTQIWALSGLK
jgi:hypothetical protein